MEADSHLPVGEVPDQRLTVGIEPAAPFNRDIHTQAATNEEPIGELERGARGCARCLLDVRHERRYTAVGARDYRVRDGQIASVRNDAIQFERSAKRSARWKADTRAPAERTVWCIKPIGLPANFVAHVRRVLEEAAECQTAGD